MASSRRGGAAAEIHDALTSGATAAVMLLREDLIEFEPGRVARCTGRALERPQLRRGRHTRRVAIAAIAVLNEKLAEYGWTWWRGGPARRCR